MNGMFIDSHSIYNISKQNVNRQYVIHVPLHGFKWQYNARVNYGIN
jgi:hypothetical protein